MCFLLSYILFVISTCTLAQSPDCESSHPNWSPDGKKIVFDGVREKQQGIFILNIEARDVQLLFDRPGRDAHPFWSPDGKQIAFQSTRDASKSFVVDIYKIGADGKNPVRLTTLDGFTGVPSWSPDGTKILFQFKPMKESIDFEKNKWHIFVMDADGKNKKQLTTGQSEYQVPNWSPDGSMIIFFSDKTGNNEIYKMRSHGTGITQLTNNPADDNGAFISPDGRMIAFKSNRDGPKEIYFMDINGGNVQRLTTGHDSFGGPSWSPDGKQIAFHSAASGRNELYVIDLQSREVLQLTNCK